MNEFKPEDWQMIAMRQAMKIHHLEELLREAVDRLRFYDGEHETDFYGRVYEAVAEQAEGDATKSARICDKGSIE